MEKTLRHIKLFEAFAYTEDHTKWARRFARSNDLALKNGMDEECIALIAWWGARGYLNYGSLRGGDSITDKGSDYIDSMYQAFKEGVFSDYKADYDAWSRESGYSHPIVAEENLWKEMGKGYIDKAFERNLTTVKEPFMVWKNTELNDKYLKIGRPGWGSFSIHKDFYRGAFGDNYVGFELPVGAKFLDTYTIYGSNTKDVSGLADSGEVLINPADLKKEWIVQRGYSKEKNTGDAWEKQKMDEYNHFIKNRKVKA